MSDSRTFWLLVTNAILGLVTVLLLLSVVTGVLCEFILKLRRRRRALSELDRDMRHMFGVHR